MAINDGGPAFPSGERLSIDAAGRRDDRVAQPLHEGLSMRDWFAGQALAGIVATIHSAKDEGDLRIVARCCYAYADAMLETRPLEVRLAAPTEQEG